MSIIVPNTRPDLVALQPVVHNTYRDIHKGIRAELFTMTLAAGNIDPSDRGDRQALADHVRRVADLLASHAHHEDTFVQPEIEAHLPHVAESVDADHRALDDRIESLAGQASEVVELADARFETYRLHVDLAAFTSSYLAHQDLEERVIMPALEAAMGPEAVFAMDQALVASIPPDEVATSLAIMIPAMNVDDRTELLGGMQAGAPAEVFAGVWNLVQSILPPWEVDALASRLGV